MARNRKNEEKKRLQEQLANLDSEFERASSEMATAGTPIPEQFVRLSEMSHRRAELLKQLGASEKEIRASYEKPSSAISKTHYSFTQALRTITAAKQDDDYERTSRITAEIGKLGSLTPEQAERIRGYGPHGEAEVARLEQTLSRRRSEASAALRVVEDQSRSKASRQMEIATSPMRIGDQGQIEMLSYDQRLGYLSQKETDLRQMLADPDPVKANMARLQMQDLAGKKYRLQVSGTREAAAGIAEAARLGPMETAPGVWQSPALAAQRTAAQTSLISAQQMAAQLKADPTAAPEQQKTANELLRKMVEQLSRIDSTIKQGQEALKVASAQSPFTKMFMQRRPGEEDAEFADRIAHTGARNRAIGASALGAITTAINTTAAIREMTFDMPRRTIGLESSVEGARQSQILQSLSYSAENRARFGGNVLFGDRTLGAPRYELANKLASAEMDRRRTAESTKAVGTGLNTALGIGQMILGGATIATAGWTGLGGVLGAGLIASGAGTMSSGLTAAAQNTRLQETGALDFLGPMSSYAGATRQAQQMQARDALMNSALERNKVNIAAQDAYQSQMDTWAQNVRMAGALAVSPMDLLKGGPEINEAVASKAGLQAAHRYTLQNTVTTGLIKKGTAGLRDRLLSLGRGDDITDAEVSGGGYTISLDKVDRDKAASIRRQARTENLNQQLTANVQKNSMQLLEETWAKYGVSAGEWSSKISAVSTQLGVGAGAMSKESRAATTAHLYEMSLAGVGTFEQIMGNQAALSNITGRTDSKDDVYKVFRDAVKAGFDDSRTGQAFMQNTIQLSNALGLRSTEQVSGRLGLGTRLLGGTEKDMEVLSRGMSQIPAMFEQNRVLGGLNFASFVAGGGLELQGSFAQTAFDISKNPERALKVRSDIERVQKKLKPNASDADINKLLESQQFKDLDPEVRGLLLTGGTAGLEQFRTVAETGYRSLINMSGIGAKKEELLSKFRGKKNLTKADREELKRGMQALRYEGRGMFMSLGQSEEAATAATTYALTNLGSDRAMVEAAFGSRGSFDRAMSEGKTSLEAASVFRRQEVVQQAALATQGLNQVKGGFSAQNLEDLAKGGKIQFMTGKGAGAQQAEIDVEKAKQLIAPGAAKATGGIEKQFQDWAANTNKLQASLQQQMLTSLESVLSGKTQQVYVMNWEGMVAAQSTFSELPAPGQK